jgi:hypothetical protein
MVMKPPRQPVESSQGTLERLPEPEAQGSQIPSTQSEFMPRTPRRRLVGEEKRAQRALEAEQGAAAWAAYEAEQKAALERMVRQRAARLKRETPLVPRMPAGTKRKP